MRKTAAVLFSVFLLVRAVSAEAAVTTVETEAAAETEASVTNENEMSDGKIFGGLLMLGSLASAACISTLIFKGRDKTKYL